MSSHDLSTVFLAVGSPVQTMRTTEDAKENEYFFEKEWLNPLCSICSIKISTGHAIKNDIYKKGLIEYSHTHAHCQTMENNTTAQISRF